MAIKIAKIDLRQQLLNINAAMKCTHKIYVYENKISCLIGYTRCFVYIHSKCYLFLDLHG